MMDKTMDVKRQTDSSSAITVLRFLLILRSLHPPKIHPPRPPSNEDGAKGGS